MLEDLIGKLAEDNGFKDVTVGMKPTGHYWINLGVHIKGKDMRIVLVNPHYVKKSKELDDNNPIKADRKDPKTMAMLKAADIWSLTYQKGSTRN